MPENKRRTKVRRFFSVRGKQPGKDEEPGHETRDDIEYENRCEHLHPESEPVDSPTLLWMLRRIAQVSLRLGAIDCIHRVSMRENFVERRSWVP
jgi:hypothetical protein